MIVKVREDKFDLSKGEYVTESEYDLDLPDEKIISKITTGFPIYYYALIDGKLFKSDQEKGLKSIFFPSLEHLEKHLADALYWRKNLIPRIGQGVGYDTKDFFEKLKESHKIEVKRISF